MVEKVKIEFENGSVFKISRNEIENFCIEKYSINRNEKKNFKIQN